MLTMMHPSWSTIATVTSANSSAIVSNRPSFVENGNGTVIGLITTSPSLQVVRPIENTLSSVLPRKRSLSDAAEEHVGPPGSSTIPSKRPERMKDWLVRQIESNEHPGLEWVDKDQGILRIPWRHAKHREYDPNTDASIFRAWAMQSGRYHGEGDQASWKANFRSAICSLPDVQELVKMRTDKHRVFKVAMDNRKHYKEPKQSPTLSLPGDCKYPSSTAVNSTSSVLPSAMPVVIVNSYPTHQLGGCGQHILSPPSLQLMDVPSDGEGSISPRAVPTPCIRFTDGNGSTSSLSSTFKSHCDGEDPPSDNNRDSPIGGYEGEDDSTSNEVTMETHPPCFEEEEEDESKENLCNLKLKQQSLTKEEDNPSSLDAIATPLDPVTTPPASAVQPSGGYFQSLHQARQFTVAVYYLSLPVVMDSVKNNYGCRLYSGSSELNNKVHQVHLPSHPHRKVQQVLSNMAQGLSIESSQDGDIYITCHTPLRVDIQCAADKSPVIQTLKMNTRTKVFDYSLFKASLADGRGLLNPCLLLSIGSSLQRTHPLVQSYVTVVVVLKGALRRMERFYPHLSSQEPETMINVLLEAEPDIECNFEDSSDIKSPQTHPLLYKSENN